MAIIKVFTHAKCPLMHSLDQRAPSLSPLCVSSLMTGCTAVGASEVHKSKSLPPEAHYPDVENQTSAALDSNRLADDSKC